MFQKIFSNWNTMRAIRLAIGIYIIVQSIQTQEWMFVALGGLFTLMPLLNIGCGGDACSTPTTKINKTDDVTFEEVKNQ